MGVEAVAHKGPGMQSPPQRFFSSDEIPWRRPLEWGDNPPFIWTARREAQEGGRGETLYQKAGRKEKKQSREESALKRDGSGDLLPFKGKRNKVLGREKK